MNGACDDCGRCRTTLSFYVGLQVSLFESIKPLFANKQLLVIANKTDVAPFKDLK